jgi:DNA methylase
MNVGQLGPATFLVGDVRERMADLPDASFDLILTSPPFLALRSYLPSDHAHKGRELGSEPDPAAYVDMLLGLTAEFRRLLAPHGSIAVELGDTYSGSGGAGGDYDPDGLRAGQPKFRQGTPRWDGRPAGQVRTTTSDPVTYPTRARAGWPLPKSLCCVPALYAVALVYGLNPLTGEPSPAGRWLLRNVKPWIRSNPPVGALGDKERPATSYVLVATTARDRYFDLDAVRTLHTDPLGVRNRTTHAHEPERVAVGLSSGAGYTGQNPIGAPPRDWWSHVDAVLDAELAARAGQPVAWVGRASGNNTKGHDEGSKRFPERVSNASPVGAQGMHLRRALERAGILSLADAMDISPKGYSGAHYAVWPPELVRQLVDEMCPRQVCTTCGKPRRRVLSEPTYVDRQGNEVAHNEWASGIAEGKAAHSNKPDGGVTRQASSVGWSDCGHATWRPGRVLDPFVGSGTTLAVTTGMGRDAVGIDLDPRNADLARERVGMFLATVQAETEAYDRRPIYGPPLPPAIEGQTSIFDALGEP